MLGNVLGRKPQVDQLTDDADPVLMAMIASNAVHRQLVVAHLADALIVGAAQHFHHVAHAKALVDAANGGERLTRVH
ncbi:Uncharacterised protein [Leclercia adecarboxylata]|uniref:Uncharacterized protein n=1 Tax=Leclercia adecarboxylata TaxID=83655 RepID=A0A4U9IVX0_9ENTR|nr:Uncharacterised protein [Leclercia adecarboxylata]